MGGSDFTRVLKKSDFSKIRDFPPAWLMGTLLWPILARGRPGELRQADFLLRAGFPAGIGADRGAIGPLDPAASLSLPQSRTVPWNDFWSTRVTDLDDFQRKFLDMAH